MSENQHKNAPKIFLSFFSYGGVQEQTCDSLIRELNYAKINGVDVCYYRISGDALISRSRSRALGIFDRTPTFKELDCIVMIDHDLEFQPGAVVKTCEQAVKENAVVGGLYCKRALGKGWASRFRSDKKIELQMGTEGLVDCDYLATGFMAIPRTVINKMVDELDEAGDRFSEKFNEAVKAGDTDRIKELCNLSMGLCKDLDGKDTWEYYDAFRTFRTPHAVARCEGFQEFLSEDWAFVHRLRHCGIPYKVYMYPLLTHYGDYGYNVIDGMNKAQREEVAHLNEK